VYTVDGARSWAQAVGVSAGHIVYVGTDQGSAAYIGPATRLIDPRSCRRRARRSVRPG
jgi:hypothetical protein